MTINDVFLNPNLAYLLLVSGVLMAIMAVLTPGTGFFELGAVFALIIAGWQVYNLPINVWALIILALGVFPFMLAVRKSGNMLYLVISIFAMLIGSTFLFQGEGLRPAVHPALALVVSAFAAGFMWIVTYKTLEALGQTPSHDMGKVIGAVGIAKSDVHLEGSVLVAREEWSAQSDDLIKAGTQVRVLGREGFILEVKPLNADDHGGDSPPGA